MKAGRVAALLVAGTVAAGILLAALLCGAQGGDRGRVERECIHGTWIDDNCVLDGGGTRIEPAENAVRPVR